MKYQLKLGERDIIFETPSFATQANGEVLVRYGDTTVLVTAVMSDKDRDDLGFFPLTVDFEEKYYAAGKILGSRYMKREGRPSDGAILSGRLIDRAIRPRFPKGLKRAVQVIITCLSWDGENDPDVLGLLGASLALSISDIPWQGPLAAARMGYLNERFVLNPTYEEREGAQLDLFLSGVEKNKQILINMLEAKAEEIKEETLFEASAKAETFLKKLISFQEEIKEKIGKEKLIIESIPIESDLEKEIKDFLGEKLEKAFFAGKKAQKMEAVNELKQDLLYFIEGKYPEMGKTKQAEDFFEQEIEKILRESILKNEKRADGRKLNELRPLNCQVGLLPRTHGSGLFARGQTKALSILTLGAPGDQQLLQGMETIGKKRFMHHYNFPPYSVGEVKPMRGPARRDIGHGMLAEKGLLPIIPSFKEFPYTIRVVSEIVSSNGSSSMASISGSSLALMDAGVPIKRPCAGIALGLIQGKNGDYKILTDIQGPEDHHGDMDLKVAGTSEGITVAQMDVKIDGISKEILKDALAQAKIIRKKILEEMEKAIPKPRAKLSPFAPCILCLQINPEKIGGVIGPGGKVIREITEKCGVEIDIEEDGLVFITAEKQEAGQKALDWVKNITRETKVGEEFKGKVTRILGIGAMVEIFAGQEGLVKGVGQTLKVGQTVSVRVSSIDDQGRINLSLNR